MIAFLVSLRGADRWLFHKINADWTCRVLDKALPVVTDLQHSKALLVFAPLVLAFWLQRRGRRAAMALLAAAAVVGFTDAFAHRVVKPFFHRARPQQAGVEVVLRTKPHYGLSFPSIHAANSFAGAAFVSSVEPAAAPWLFFGAAAVAYSRVYTGVHFPLDVLGGAALGLLVGGVGALLFRRYAGSSMGQGGSKGSA